MSTLQKRKVELLENIASFTDVVKGSIYELKRFCGKKNCRCYKTKTPHTSLMLSFSYKGKTRLVPIRKNQVSRTKKNIKDYKKLKAHIDELAKINSELLRERKG